MQNKPETNQQLIDTLEKRIEEQLNYTIRVFQNLDEEILNRPSATGGWSIAQCLQHLNTYGEYYLPLINGSLMQAENCAPSQQLKPGILGNYFTNLMEPREKTNKMKAAKIHVPGTINNPHTVVAHFIQQQETLLNYVRLAKNKNLNRSTIPVSVFKLIKLNTADVFRFMVAHNQRHILQAQRNLPVI